MAFSLVPATQALRGGLVTLLACCAASLFAATPAPPQATPQATQNPAQKVVAPAVAPAAGSEQINLTSYANGAWLLVRPAEYDESWSAFWLLDERSSTGWASPKAAVGPHQVVIALPERSQVQRLEFDSASVDGDAAGSRSAKDIVVELSDAGPASGYAAIASVTLKPKLDKQSFNVAPAAPGRWLRLTIKSNHGSPDYVELFDVRAWGVQKSSTPAANISGTYATNFENFHIQQDGAAVTGCYEHANGLITNGGIDGAVTRFTWVQGAQGEKRGPAILAFSPDRKELFGLWWEEGDREGPGSIWKGKKVSDAVGSCPHWKGVQEAGSQLAKDVATTGRARIYGINFDTDSDVIQTQSKPALDSIVKLAKDKPDWKFVIEGHTDATATAEHNQALSDKRATAVRAYLVSAGVAAARLSTRGLGATQPVGDNKTSVGRAQNRRVELVKG